MYTNQSTLESNITPPVSSDNQVYVYNINNPNDVSVGEYIILYIDSSVGSAIDESTAGSLIDYTTSSGTLSSSTTGLSSTFNYSKTRTGWIYLYDGTDYQPTKVKQYYAPLDTDADYSSSVLEILEIGSVAASTYTYNWTDSALVIRDNTVVVVIDDDFPAYNESDETTPQDIDNALVEANATLEITSNDLIGVATYWLIVKFKDGVGGSVIATDNDSTSTPATLEVDLSAFRSSFTQENVEVEVELTIFSP